MLRDILLVAGTVISFLGLIISVLTLLAIVVTATVYYFQLKEMQKASEAATKAAKAAEEGVTFARESAHLDQRAWVAPFEVTGELAVSKPYIVSVAFKNTGKTFARHAQILLKIDIDRKGSPPNFDSLFDSSESRENRPSILLAPDAVYRWTSDPIQSSPFTQEQIDNLRDNSDLFVYGRITYDDVFDGDHWTTFCYRYDFRSNTYGYYEKYNDADNPAGVIRTPDNK